MSDSTTPQDSAAMSPASGGSRPVAWIAVFDGDDADGEFVWPDKGRATEWASARPGVKIAPLYLSPTLTDEEREAIGWAAEMLEVGSLPNSLHRDDAAKLRGLLERLG